MSTEGNKNVLRHLIEEAVDEGNTAATGELVGADVLAREDLLAGVTADREPIKQLLAMWHSSLPDVKIAVDDLIAEGDTVIARWGHARGPDG